MSDLKPISGGIVALSLVFTLLGPVPVSAASAPTLGLAESYAVFGKAGVTNDSDVGTTQIWGDVGADSSVTGLNDVTQVDGSIVTGAGVAGVETAISAAYDDLDAELATGSLDLAGTNTVTPGVYTVGATTLNGTLTLDGAGVYIFRSSSSISTSGPAVMELINGATACNVFWQIPTSMTIGTGSILSGTIIAQNGLISLAPGATLEGRAFSRIDQVTLDSNQITEPVCAPPPSPGGGVEQYSGTITVVKTVINDNGGTATFDDFPLFINGTEVVSGQTNAFSFYNSTYYTVSETEDSDYEQSFSGDCDVDGMVFLDPTENAFCVITNDDIGAPVIVPPVPPLIAVVKVPSPLALPDGPGSVMYTYTVTNPGTVPLSTVTMVGDTCSPITRISGDTDADGNLDTNESWVYTCSTTLTETHTNTVVATGWANGLSAVDIASATVIVGEPVIPPLIHVTKVPSPLTLPFGGGMVTYTEKISNPGTVPLENVTLTDDTCGPMVYVSGDADTDVRLDVSEIWTYTCSTNVTENTLNTAIASGSANGFTVRDVAVAAVVVATAVPALPITGIDSMGGESMLYVLAAILAGSALILFVARKKSLK